MIEIVYNKPETPESSNPSMKLPKNIKQVGGTNTRRKIYIEDYVMSYINSLAKKKSELSVGVLLGTSSVNEGERYLFIKGAIKVRDFELGEGRIIFTENSWTGIYEDINKYFPSLSILGWYVIMEDLDNLHRGSLEKTHIDNFAGNEKTLFVFETDKDLEGFYFYENGELVKENGYYIYYERNENMQEYMILKEPKETVEKVNEAVRENHYVEAAPEKKDSSARLLTFMYSVSTFLIVVVIVMGIHMMNSYDKLSNVENAVDSLAGRFISGSEKNTESTMKLIEVGGKIYETASQIKSSGKAEESSVTQTETQSETQSESQTESQSETQTKPVSVTVSVRTHTVVKGDTLASISKKYYGDESMVQAIMELNGIKDANKIYLGQSLKLPNE